MTLSTRVSAFFLTALAAVLAVVVGVLWLIARHELNAQLRQRLTAGVESLAGSAEVEPHELEWDPAEHQIALGREAADDRVQWIIRSADGTVVDRSPNVPDATLAVLTETAPAALAEEPVTTSRGDWLLMHRRVRAKHPEQAPPDEPLEPFDYTELTFSGAVDVRPARDTLRDLGLTASALALGVWCVAALLGRWYCRRALSPLRRMADEARRITSAPGGQALQMAGSGDELQELGEAFNGLLRRWREMFERQSSFSASVAHQLRSPLTVMLGELELSLRRPRSTEEQRTVIAHAHSAAEQLRRTIEGLLFLTRSDSEHEPPDAAEIDLGDWLREQLAGRSAHPRAGDLHLAIRSGEPVLVRASAVLLAQVLENLLDNAIKYSPEGASITVELDGSSDAALLTVADAGPGILSEDLPHLFELFYRSKSVRRSGMSGTGLGLPLAARIAELHGGRIEVSSTPGEGSRFTLCLPRVRAGAPSLGEPEPVR